MGFGFVLFAWGIILSILSIPILGFAYLLILFLRKRQGKATSKKQLFKFGFVVPIVLIFCFFSFLFTSIFNEYVRGVDPGIGDGWKVPITNDYAFSMIDVTNFGFIKKGDRTILDGVVSVNVLSDIIIGQSKDSMYFSINTLNGSITKYSSDEFQSEFQNAQLRSANKFYLDQRNWIVDAIIGILTIILPSLLLVVLWYKKSFVEG